MILSPTVGIDLVMYAGRYSTALHVQQPTVDNVIVQINCFIREINTQNGLPTPNTSYCIHRCRGRGVIRHITSNYMMVATQARRLWGTGLKP